MSAKLCLYKDEDEQKLIAACVKKDKTAQSIVYKRLYGKMLALCIRYIGDRDAAQDLVQDGFILLFDKIASYQASGSFEGWARKLFINTCLNRLRHNDVLRFTEPVTLPQAQRVTLNDAPARLRARDVMQCIASLPAGCRTVFNMSAVEGYSYTEIAQILQIEESTVRSHYARARSLLQKKMEEMDYEH